MDDIQSWWEVPSIAHFCSLFRAAFNLLDFDIEELEEALLTDGAEDSGSSLLQELIVRLLCGCLGNNDISTFNYQMFLRRLFRQKCQEYGRENPFNTDIDFQFLPLRTKVEILHALCDFRLDAEDVQDLLKNLESDSLRVEPLGHDENHSAYWYFYGTRLYREDYPKAKKKVKEKHHRGKEEKRRKKRGKSPPPDSESDEKGVGIWQVVCYTEQDWDKITESFRDSTSKNERALFHTLAEDFLPEIPRLFAEKERLQRKRLLEYQPRRQSSRLEKLKQQKEEEEKMLQREEEERLRQEREKKERLQQQEMLKERESRALMAKERVSRALRRSLSRTNSECGSTGSIPDSLTDNRSNRSSTFVGRQTNNSLSSATGQIVIQGLRQKLCSSQVFKQTKEDLQTGMYKILEYIKNHDDAWPFADPVDEDYAPRYYSIIRQPMDLQRMEDKLDDGEYLTFADFKADFQLIVDNCRQYNGTDNEYTEMVGNLQEAFQMAVERYLESDLSSDEVAVEFPTGATSSESRTETQGHRHKHHHHHRARRKKEKSRQSSHINRNVPSPESEHTVRSSTAAEREEVPNAVTREKEQDDKTDGMDTEGSSTKGDAVEVRRPRNHNGTKRKKKTGVIKNVAEIEALELATEQTLKDINKWLDDTPRFSEFSSASNSPSHLIGAEEYDIVRSRIESEYRHSLKLDRDRPASGTSSRSNKDGKDLVSKRRSIKDSSKQHQHRRREIQRTIERLQPGKSKGNLISNIQGANKMADEVGGSSSSSSMLGLSNKPKDNRNSLLVKTDEATPKLSLGTVLTSDVLGFGVAGHNNHNFDSSEGALIEDKKPPVLLTDAEGGRASPRDIHIKLSAEKQKRSLPGSSQSPGIKKEDEKTATEEGKSISKDVKHEKVTPNLSAWFKAFGAPKTTAVQKQRKTEVSAQQEMDTCTDNRRLETVRSPSPVLTDVPSCSGTADRSQIVGDTGLRPPTQEDLDRKMDDAPSPTQPSVASTQRQRKVSTGSSMSERSSFSQDPMDPLDGYPAPYPSPLHRSPMAASPVMASPRPEDPPKPTTSYSPLNGTIRVGFYQDTSSSLQKSSPEKSNSSCSPQSPSPFQQSIYPSRYPPHDTPGYLTYRNPTPGPPQPYDGLPVPPYSPVMQYYDTSKPLTDQYRAARTQASDEYIPGGLSLSYSSGQQQGYPSPGSASASSLPYTSDRQSGFPLSVPRPNSAHRSPPVPATSSGLLGTFQFSSSQQQGYDISVPRPSALHRSSPSAVTSSLPFSTSQQQGYEISVPHPSSMNKTSSASVVTVPSTVLPFSCDRPQGCDTSVPRPNAKAAATVFPVKKRLYSDIESGTGHQHHHQTASRLHPSPPSPVTTVSATSPSPVGISQPISLPPHTSGNRLPNSTLSNQNIGRRLDQTSPVNISQSPHSAVVEQVCTSPVSIPVSSPQTSVSQATERLLPTSKQQTASERTLANPVREIDGAQHPDSMLQAAEKSHKPTGPHVTERLYSQEIIPPSERIHRSVTSPVGNHQMSTVSSFSVQQPIDTSSRQVSSKQPSIDQLRQSPATVCVGNDITFHRGPFSPAAPSSISNLTNLSHIVDRFSSEGSPFYTTGGDKSGIFGHGSVQPPISSAAAAMAMFSQPAPTISYNRSVPELSSVLSSKVSDVQSVYCRTVPELSSVLPGKSAPPITSVRPPPYDRAVSELTSYGRQTMEISTGLPNKATPSVDGQTSYNHSVTDLPSMLTNKVPPSTAINVAAPTYNRSVVVTDFSMVPTKVPPRVEVPPLSASAVATSTSKPSRKRKTKQQQQQQQQVTSSSDTAVSSSSTTAFQQYVSEPSAISLKTVQTSVVPGSAFNFGPATSGLGLYGDAASFLDEYRSPPTSYYIPTGTDPGRDKQTPAPPAPPFPFLGHPQQRPPPAYPQLAPAFINHQPALMDASGATSPLYQQYLQRHQEELLRHSAANTPMVLHQGLLAPTSGYPPGYHPALGIRQPFDALNRPSWL